MPENPSDSTTGSRAAPNPEPLTTGGVRCERCGLVVEHDVTHECPPGFIDPPAPHAFTDKGEELAELLRLFPSWGEAAIYYRSRCALLQEIAYAAERYLDGYAVSADFREGLAALRRFDDGKQPHVSPLDT